MIQQLATTELIAHERTIKLSFFALTKGTMRTICFSLAISASVFFPATHADAQSNATALSEVFQSLMRENPSCNVDIQYIGNLTNNSAADGAKIYEPAMLIAYGVSGCEGGNNWTSYVSLFGLDRGKLIALRGSPLNFPIIDSMVFTGNAATFVTKEYGQNDAHCCPSIEKTVTVTFSKGNMFSSASPSRIRKQ